MAKEKFERNKPHVNVGLVPLSAMFGYVGALRSMTQGRASYTMQFSHYDQAPDSVVDGIVAR